MLRWFRVNRANPPQHHTVLTCVFNEQGDRENYKRLYRHDDLWYDPENPEKPVEYMPDAFAYCNGGLLILPGFITRI